MAVCFLWPVPSPYGAQVLPGSLPCGARTFLSAPLRPAHRDHHALPPPGGKVSASQGWGQASTCQAPHQPHQTVARESRPWAPRAPRGSGAACFAGEPEAIVILEDGALQTGPVARPEERRRKLQRVYAVHPPRAEQREHLTPEAKTRSEEHTSELQSQSNLVCRLLLEKKKKNNYIREHHNFMRAHKTNT